jgi:hypothetical protein
MTPSREDYNERSPERTELLTRLKNALGGKNVNAVFWACCQLGDMESLEALVRMAKEKPLAMLDYGNQASIIPLQCKSPDFQDLLRLCLTINMLTPYREPNIPRSLAIRAILCVLERIKESPKFRWKGLGAAFKPTTLSC